MKLLYADVVAMSVLTANAAVMVNPTVGPIVDSPLKIVTTNPFETVTPQWIFPRYTFKWKPMQRRKKTVEDFAHLYVQEFLRRNDDDQPVWIELSAWTGRYKGGWDKDHLLAYEKDVTPQGTPGLWPREGIRFWKQNTRRFIKVLKENGMRVDGLIDDNETNITRFNSNFRRINCFRNMVLDLRWSTESILGLGITGAQLLSPTLLTRAKPSQWHSSGFEDSALATQHVEVLGKFVNAVARREAYYDEVAKEYPHISINKFGGTYGLPLDWRSDTPYPLMRAYEKNEHPHVWKKLSRLVTISEMPGIGNTCGPVFFGFKTSRDLEQNGHDQVRYYLEKVDKLIRRGIPPDRIMPWINMPNNPRKDNPAIMRLSLKEYEQLVVGIANRGIRQMFLFNHLKRQSQTSEEQAIACLKKAYMAAQKYTHQ